MDDSVCGKDKWEQKDKCFFLLFIGQTRTKCQEAEEN